MPRRYLPVLALLPALALTLSACQGGDSNNVGNAAGTGATAPTVPGTAPSSDSSPPQASSPVSADPLSPLSPVPPAPNGPASTAPRTPAGYDVAAVQTVLRDQRYYGGAVDGKAGPALRSAVMAFQKVQGMGADGSVGPQTLAALKAPKAPSLRDSRPANRVEVDLGKQVLYVVKNGALARVLPVSSGNGATYSQKSGGTAKALTPSGYYTIQRRIVGVRDADLGRLYDPQYFYRGWAIHGSNSVPAYPASHGCVRVTRADARYLLDAMSVGTTVHLYGGRFTFPAGSAAPGTDNPTGDTPQDSSPAPVPPAASPSSTRAPSPAASRAPSPTPSRQPRPTPSRQPSPAASRGPSPAASSPTAGGAPSPAASPARA